MQDKIIELAKKLYELVKRGEGGEQENAKLLLEKMMQKHNLSYADIEDEHKIKCRFPVRIEQKDIFFQIFASVMGYNFEISYIKGSRNPRKYVFELTASQAIEINAKFDFYWKLWQKEMKTLKAAFVMKHNLYPANGEAVDYEQLTEEEKERIRNAKKMKDGLQDESYHKRLTHS